MAGASDDRSDHAVIRADFAIIDSQFPQRVPYGFRNIEIVEYLRRFSNVTAFAMNPMRPGPDAWFGHGYGVPRKEFRANKQGFLSVSPDLGASIRWLSDAARYEIGLAYSFFLAETYTLLPFYERHRVPFVFMLYPGGAFGLNNESSDAMLRAIFGSEQFRAVIVSQHVTRDYLLERRLCPPERIHFVFGGFIQIRPADVLPKVRLGEGKDSFDACFVAAKYSPQGEDKGYDLFIAAAGILAERDPQMRFHVVGNFDASDIALGPAAGAVTFHGILTPDRLRDLFARMDVFVSPNRPGVLFPGNFDGFPLGADAAACEVALLVADPLGINTHYKDGQELVTIPLDAERIAEIVLELKSAPRRLREISASGRARTEELWAIDHQIEQRVAVFRRFTDLHPRTRRVGGARRVFRVARGRAKRAARRFGRPT